MKEEIINQFKASIKMLIDTIGKCPDSLWNDERFDNKYWHIVYHTLFYASLYLSNTLEEFIPWEKHKENYNLLDSRTRDNVPIVIDSYFSKDEMIDYAGQVIKKIELSINENQFNEPGGFYWLKMTRLGVQIYNIRHVQHHTGQLIERLRHEGVTGIKWEATG